MKNQFAQSKAQIIDLMMLFGFFQKIIGGRWALQQKKKYDLVSLDYVLPGNLTGMDIYHHIRQKDKTLPVLFISGNLEFIESIKELKTNDKKISHLPKPSTNKDYAGAINELLINSVPKQTMELNHSEETGR